MYNYCIQQQKLIVIAWLFRIEQVLDEQSALLMNECKVYDEAASKEEERVDSIRGALSKLANTINLDSTIDEDNAVEW